MTAAVSSGLIPPPQLHPLRDRVYAYVQPDGSWGLNNTGFVVGSDRVLVIDSCRTERRTRGFLERLREVTDLPVRTLVNTHHHGDHTFGNYLFPEATIVSHAECRAEVLRAGLDLIERFPRTVWGDVRLAPPQLTFEDRLVLHVDDVRVEILAAAPAHSRGDAMVWLPEYRLLFAGDLFFKNCTPFLFEGCVGHYLEVLERVRALAPEIVVPGHGPICGPEVIDETVAYLRFLQQAARTSLDAGLAPLAAARALDLGPFAAWTDHERIVANLARAYSELRDEPVAVPLDFPHAFADMATYLGRPLTSLA